VGDLPRNPVVKRPVVRRRAGRLGDFPRNPVVNRPLATRPPRPPPSAAPPSAAGGLFRPARRSPARRYGRKSAMNHKQEDVVPHRQLRAAAAHDRPTLQEPLVEHAGAARDRGWRHRAENGICLQTWTNFGRSEAESLVLIAAAAPAKRNKLPSRSGNALSSKGEGGTRFVYDVFQIAISAGVPQRFAPPKRNRRRIHCAIVPATQAYAAISQSAFPQWQPQRFPPVCRSDSKQTGAKQKNADWFRHDGRAPALLDLV
jgi:hypothetical protein